MVGAGELGPEPVPDGPNMILRYLQGFRTSENNKINNKKHHRICKSPDTYCQAHLLLLITFHNQHFDILKLTNRATCSSITYVLEIL